MAAVVVRSDRLLADLDALAAVGDTGDGGNCRLALSDDDAQVLTDVLVELAS